MRSSEIENQIDRQPFFVLSWGLFACVCPHLHNVTLYCSSFTPPDTYTHSLLKKYIYIYIFCFISHVVLLLWTARLERSDDKYPVSLWHCALWCAVSIYVSFTRKIWQSLTLGKFTGRLRGFLGTEVSVNLMQHFACFTSFLCAHSAKSDHCRASGVGQVEGCVSAVPNGL